MNRNKFEWRDLIPSRFIWRRQKLTVGLGLPREEYVRTLLRSSQVGYVGPRDVTYFIAG